MSRTVRISDATMAGLEGVAKLPFVNTSKPDGPGWWLTEIEDASHAGVQAMKMPGETDNDVIMSIIAKAGARGRPQ